MKNYIVHYRNLLWVVLLFAVLVSGCATNPVTGRSQLSLMSMTTEEEVNLGKNMFPQVMQKMGGAYPDEELQRYLQQVGERLTKAGYRQDISYTFKVVNDSTPNAFAMPGGYIAITRGLLVNLESEAQLAAVIGHEIGHVEARHAIQGLQRSNLLGLGLAVLSGVTSGTQYGSLIRSSGEVAATLVDRSYSRGQEEESDRLGIDYMVQTGYNPQGAVELQKIFYHKIEKGEDPQWVEGLFRTHPFSKKRLDGNRTYIAKKYGEITRPDHSEDVTFLKKISRLRKTRVAYELYDKARQAEKEGSTKESISLYLEAAAMAPEEALILSGLGIAYLRTENFVSAKQHLLRALKFDRNYYLSHLGLAYIYLNQERNAETIKHAERSFELFSTVEGAYILARGYEESGDIKKALELYRVVETYDPGGKMGKDASARIVVLEG